jgi:putative endonuclease
MDTCTQDPSLRLKSGYGRDDAAGKVSDMPRNRRFFVYIMTNRPRSHVLYTGITGNLQHRVFQHKNKLVFGFTSRYNLTRLVYYEEFVYPDGAISREKEIKAWRRSKKIRLIESMNSHWRDLAEKWTEIYAPELKRAPTYFEQAARQIPPSA